MLTGTWRMVEYEENQDVERVEWFAFYENGNYQLWVGYRESGSGAFLGYQFYAEGTYALEGNRALIQEGRTPVPTGGNLLWRSESTESHQPQHRGMGGAVA